MVEENFGYHGNKLYTNLSQEIKLKAKLNYFHKITQTVFLIIRFESVQGVKKEVTI